MLEARKTRTQVYVLLPNSTFYSCNRRHSWFFRKKKKRKRGSSSL